MAVTFIDLFAGIGGFHAAGESFGWECVFANEMDPAAASVYEQNWDLKALGNIHEYTRASKKGTIPAHDVLFAGFPCQPFSKSGKQKGMDEDRGSLFHDIAFILEGKSQSITTIERLVLNVMQRMSGIATETHRLTQMIAHTNCKLLDTRKTTPNFRYFEKEAVRIGGGYNHRYALYDMILVKDNHIDFAGGVKPALSKISEFIKERNLSIKVEVETRNLEEVDEVIETSVAFRIMLDNFTPEKLREAVLHINGRVETEASGGINENTLVSYAETGVDFISMGALTHHVKSFDLSLKAIK